MKIDEAPIEEAKEEAKVEEQKEEAVAEPEAEEKVDLATVGFVTDRKHLEQCGSPKIAGKKSIKVELKKGETYWYCTCGRSESQPFCDGSHNQEGCGFKPLKFTHEQEDGEYSICQCKHNKPEKGPYCDGSHKSLAEKVDW